jgi:tRNA nucleotidyltransferase (CCA-adding enzyme)
MMSAEPSIEDLGEALAAAHPELESVRAAADSPVYVVGGAVRDLLLGRAGGDVDLVVLGDVAALAQRLGGSISSHERFGTARVEIGGRPFDLATARTETYARPGALPDVEPTADLAADLRRRDFTINAMAIPLSGGAAELLDPHGGRADLAAGLLRVLHDESFREDPTRAIRAARYASRLGLAVEPETETLLREADLGTVSGERREAELRRLAGEANAPRGFELLAEWGVLPVPREGIELAEAIVRLLASPPWQGFAPRADSVLAAIEGAHGKQAALAAAVPRSPSEAVDLARGSDPVTLAVARTLGAEWLDSYLSEHRHVSLAIDGGDLIAAGVPRGPAVGRGLDAALRVKLDGGAADADAELAVALAAARGR